METGSRVGRRRIERSLGFLGELGLVSLDGKEVIATLLADGYGHSAMTMQSVAADQGAFQGEELDRFDGGLGFAAGLQHRLTEAEEGLAIETVTTNGGI